MNLKITNPSKYGGVNKNTTTNSNNNYNEKS